MYDIYVCIYVCMFMCVYITYKYNINMCKMSWLTDQTESAPVSRHGSKDSLSSDHSNKDDYDAQWLSQVWLLISHAVMLIILNQIQSWSVKL